MALIEGRIVRMFYSKTGRRSAWDKTDVTSAGTVAIASSTLKQRETDLVFSASSGATTVNITEVDDSVVGDVVTMHFTGSGGTHTITFGTNCVVNSTLAAASGKTAIIQFKFNGTKYVELARFVQA